MYVYKKNRLSPFKNLFPRRIYLFNISFSFLGSSLINRIELWLLLHFIVIWIGIGIGKRYLPDYPFILFMLSMVSLIRDLIKYK